jgi:hypothetical protein
VFALIVDAKDDAAGRFYWHHGFAAFSGRAARLFLPVATARRAASLARKDERAIHPSTSH